MGEQKIDFSSADFCSIRAYRDELVQSRGRHRFGRLSGGSRQFSVGYQEVAYQSPLSGVLFVSPEAPIAIRNRALMGEAFDFFARVMTSSEEFIRGTADEGQHLLFVRFERVGHQTIQLFLKSNESNEIGFMFWSVSDSMSDLIDLILYALNHCYGNWRSYVENDF